MNTTQCLVRVGWMIAIALALVPADSQAQVRQGPDNHSRAESRAIEGVWLPVVTIVDCGTSAVIASFPSMETYVRGGGYISFGAVRQSDQIGMGAWRHVGGRRYVADYQFFNYTPMGAPDGTPDGTMLKVSATIRLNADGTAFTSTERAAVVDADGHVLVQICGSRQATRLQ